MCIAQLAASRFVLLLICFSFATEFAEAEPPAIEESKVADLALVKNPRFTSTLPGVKEELKWLSGVKKWTDEVPESYILMVPGGEGYPAHLEQRQRSVTVAKQKHYRWEFTTIEFLNMDLQPIEADEAQKRILNEAAFLLAAPEGEITQQDRNLYNQNLVIVRPK